VSPESNFKLGTLNVKLLSPCAGITLIRFCGFDLSLSVEEKHPGNTEKFINAAKIGEEIFNRL
jgi:hypothetical protein